MADRQEPQREESTVQERQMAGVFARTALVMEDLKRGHTGRDYATDCRVAEIEAGTAATR